MVHGTHHKGGSQAPDICPRQKLSLCKLGIMQECPWTRYQVRLVGIVHVYFKT